MSVSLRRFALLISVTGSVSWAYAATRNPAEGKVLVALVRGTLMDPLVGQYDPQRHKWLSNREKFRVPLPPVTFTLFGVDGKIAGVQIDDTYKQGPDEVPWTWHTKVEPWDRSRTNVALALLGEWPDTPRHAESVALDDPEAVSRVVDYLKQRRMDVPQPRLNRVLRVDLNGDGRPQLLICANSDNVDAPDASPAMVYALALLVTERDGKLETLPIREMAYHKPAHQQMDEYQRRFGRLAHYDILALPDIKRDGHLQIAVVNDNRSEGPEVGVYEFKDGRPVQALLAQPFYFGTLL